MSQQPPPSLEQYPGYFPAAEPPFWTRAKVGVAAGIAGLVIGVAASPGSADPAAALRRPTPAPEVSAADVQAKVDDAVVAAEDRMGDQLASVRDGARKRLEEVRGRAAATQRRAVEHAVARTHARDHAALVRAVATARAAAQPAAVASSSGSSAGSSAGVSAATDPHFSYCYEANGAGYGPYFQGQDPEYAWYDDADGDGEVCE